MTSNQGRRDRHGKEPKGQKGQKGRLHAVRKTPKPEEFRVQEEHGGLIEPADPPAGLIDLGRRCLAVLDQPTLYARVDLVRLAAGGHALMELELIEPSLYFRMEPGSARRFARALEAWVGRV